MAEAVKFQAHGAIAADVTGSAHARMLRRSDPAVLQHNAQLMASRAIAVASCDMYGVAAIMTVECRGALCRKCCAGTRRTGGNCQEKK
jgi:hypothetical protein